MELVVSSPTALRTDIRRPRRYGSGWLSPSPSWTSKALPATTPDVKSLATTALVGVADSFVSVARTLPPHLLLSLIYRVTVLHLAARIVPVIRKSSMGWDDGMNDATPGFWDGRSLGEEPAVGHPCVLIFPVLIDPRICV